MLKNIQLKYLLHIYRIKHIFKIIFYLIKKQIIILIVLIINSI